MSVTFMFPPNGILCCHLQEVEAQSCDFSLLCIICLKNHTDQQFVHVSQIDKLQ